MASNRGISQNLLGCLGSQSSDLRRHVKTEHQHQIPSTRPLAPVSNNLISPFTMLSGFSPKTERADHPQEGGEHDCQEQNTDDHQPDASGGDARADDREFADENIERWRADQRQRADHQQQGW